MKNIFIEIIDEYSPMGHAFFGLADISSVKTFNEWGYYALIHTSSGCVGQNVPYKAFVDFLKNTLSNQELMTNTDKLVVIPFIVTAEMADPKLPPLIPDPIKKD